MKEARAEYDGGTVTVEPTPTGDAAVWVRHGEAAPELRGVYSQAQARAALWALAVSLGGTVREVEDCGGCDGLEVMLRMGRDPRLDESMPTGGAVGYCNHVDDERGEEELPAEGRPAWCPLPRLTVATAETAAAHKQRRKPRRTPTPPAGGGERGGEE